MAVYLLGAYLVSFRVLSACDKSAPEEWRKDALAAWRRSKTSALATCTHTRGREEAQIENHGDSRIHAAESNHMDERCPQKSLRRIHEVGEKTVEAREDDTHGVEEEARSSTHKELAKSCALDVFYDGLILSARDWQYILAARDGVIPQTQSAESDGFVEDEPTPMQMCKRMRELGLKTISFVGDTFMKEAFLAVTSTLQTQNPCQVESWHSSDPIKVCDGRILLQYFAARSWTVLENNAAFAKLTSCSSSLVINNIVKGLRPNKWMLTRNLAPAKQKFDCMSGNFTGIWISSFNDDGLYFDVTNAQWQIGNRDSFSLYFAESCNQWLDQRIHGSGHDLCGMHRLSAARTPGQSQQKARETDSEHGAAPAGMHHHPSSFTAAASLLLPSDLLEDKPHAVHRNCRYSEHIHGQWSLIDSTVSRRHGPPPCPYSRKAGPRSQRHLHRAQADSNHFDSPLIMEELGIDKLWTNHNVTVRQDRGNYYCDDLAESCDFFQDRYVWSPSRCRLLAWDAERFCQLLGERKMLFVGDSTMAQAALTVMNWIQYDGNASHENSEHKSGDNGFRDASSTTGHCLQRIGYFKSNTLVDVINNRGTVINSGWTKAVHMLKPHIVVIGASAHITFTAEYQAVIAQVRREHQIMFPDVKLFWKTSQPGGCDLDILHRLPSSQKDFWDTYEGLQYNFRQFELYDQLARSLFSDPGTNSFVLDLQPLHLRADAHPGSVPVPGDGYSNGWKYDCLHMCQPGPLDLIPPLLLNLMISSAEKIND